MPGKPTHISFSLQFYDMFIDCLKDAIELAKSEILKDENLPIGNIVSEGASSSLISEKSPEVRKETVQQIENSAEEKNDR